MKTINSNDLLSGNTQEQGPDRAEFKADTLHVQITRPDGTVVAECDMEPRGFQAKENKKTGRTVGGVGWYADIRGDELGTYGAFSVNGGLRLSLDKVKVEPGTIVDLSDQ
jgi:hypothetical protein